MDIEAYVAPVKLGEEEEEGDSFENYPALVCHHLPAASASPSRFLGKIKEFGRTLVRGRTDIVM